LFKGETPEEITPHRYAQIGGNHVIGLIKVSRARGSGRRRDMCKGSVTLIVSIKLYIPSRGKGIL
jgi:hypothetical protein